MPQPHDISLTPCDCERGLRSSLFRSEAVRIPSRAATAGLPRIKREYRQGDSHGKSPDRERGHNAASISLSPDSLSPKSTGGSAPKTNQSVAAQAERGGAAEQDLDRHRLQGIGDCEFGFLEARHDDLGHQ